MCEAAAVYIRLIQCCNPQLGATLDKKMPKSESFSDIFSIFLSISIPFVQIAAVAPELSASALTASVLTAPRSDERWGLMELF